MTSAYNTSGAEEKRKLRDDVKVLNSFLNSIMLSFLVMDTLQQLQCDSAWSICLVLRSCALVTPHIRGSLSSRYWLFAFAPGGLSSLSTRPFLVFQR